MEKKDLRFEARELCAHPGVAEELLEGQLDALSGFNVSREVLASVDVVPTPGTQAVLARSADGELVGGVRLHFRAGGSPLPIEGDGSPLSAELRDWIRAERSICEIRGLWVAPHAAGRFLSRKLVALATAYCYRLGFSGLVGFAHQRTLRFIVEPLGYERDPSIPAMDYPDARFQSVVVWHRAGYASAARHLGPELAESWLATTEASLALPRAPAPLPPEAWR